MSISPLSLANQRLSESSERYCPELTVAAVVERDGRFLIIEELVRGVPVLNQPSGHVERNEEPLDAVVRETLEESGHHIQPTGLIGGYLWQSPRGTEYFRLAYHAELTQTQAEKPLEESTLDVLWLRRDELANMSERLRTPLVVSVIDDFIERGCVRHDIHTLCQS